MTFYSVDLISVLKVDAEQIEMFKRHFPFQIISNEYFHFCFVSVRFALFHFVFELPASTGNKREKRNERKNEENKNQFQFPLFCIAQHELVELSMLAMLAMLDTQLMKCRRKYKNCDNKISKKSTKNCSQMRQDFSIHFAIFFRLANRKMAIHFTRHRFPLLSTEKSLISITSTDTRNRLINRVNSLEFISFFRSLIESGRTQSSRTVPNDESIRFASLRRYQNWRSMRSGFARELKFHFKQWKIVDANFMFCGGSECDYKKALQFNGHEAFAVFDSRTRFLEMKICFSNT